MTILSYLRFALREGVDRDAFQEDLAEMLELAQRQPGFRWAEVARGLFDDHLYLVVSEWDEVDQVRAWEHHPDHDLVIHRWEDEYGEPFLHTRWVPWVRPPTENTSNPSVGGFSGPALDLR